MYRIELKPGEENVFRTIEELATGIRNGLVTPKARIYHNASQKWLPIEFHPHYKKALAMPAAKAGKSGETPAVSVSAPCVAVPAPAAAPAPTPAPVHFPAPTPAIASAPSLLAPAPVAVAVAAPVAVAVVVASPVTAFPTIAYAESEEEEDDDEEEKAPLPVAHTPLARGPLGRPRRLYLGIAAIVLIAGTYAAVSAAMPSRKAAGPSPAQEKPQPSAEQPADSGRANALAATTANGPTFGGLPVSAPVPPKRPITASIGATPAGPAASDSATIEPAPAVVDLSLPSLPRGDSLTPVATTDSTAMRRILRAVGGKGAPVTPAQP